MEIVLAWRIQLFQSTKELPPRSAMGVKGPTSDLHWFKRCVKGRNKMKIVIQHRGTIFKNVTLNQDETT